MQTAAEFNLMADNCATAAIAAPDRDEQLELILMSAMWRNEALRVRLGDRAALLRQCPFDPEHLEII